MLGRQKRTYAAKKQDSRKHMGVSPREAGRKNLRRKESGQQETHGRKPSGGRESLKGRKAALGGNR